MCSHLLQLLTPCMTLYSLCCHPHLFTSMPSLKHPPSLPKKTSKELFRCPVLQLMTPCMKLLCVAMRPISCVLSFPILLLSTKNCIVILIVAIHLCSSLPSYLFPLKIEFSGEKKNCMIASAVARQASYFPPRILKSITFLFKSAFPRAARLNSYKVSAESRQRNAFTMTNSLIGYISQKLGVAFLGLVQPLPPWFSQRVIHS